jgi:hypothetical protein
VNPDKEIVRFSVFISMLLDRQHWIEMKTKLIERDWFKLIKRREKVLQSNLSLFLSGWRIFWTQNQSNN